MTASLAQWVDTHTVRLIQKENQDPFYFFVGVDVNGKRCKIFSDASFKERIVHFIAAIESGKSVRMPIVPKSNGNNWHICLELADADPPIPRKAISQSRQLTIKHSIGGTKKESFRIDSHYASRATALAVDSSTTKSELYASIVKRHIDSLEMANCMF